MELKDNKYVASIIEALGHLQEEGTTDNIHFLCLISDVDDIYTALHGKGKDIITLIACAIIENKELRTVIRIATEIYTQKFYTQKFKEGEDE